MVTPLSLLISNMLVLHPSAMGELAVQHISEVRPRSRLPQCCPAARDVSPPGGTTLL